MRAPKLKPYIAVLDVGTSKICCMIFKGTGGAWEAVGVGCVPAYGIRAGAIADMDKATECIHAAIRQAEHAADRRVDSVVVNVSSSQLKSAHVYKEIEVPDDRPVSATDVRRLVDGIVASHLNPEEELLHAFPLGYVVDGEQGSTDPRGLHARTLGAHVHLISILESQVRNLAAVLDRCHVSIEAKVATPYASALAVLTEEEKELGATAVDMGAGTTSFASFLGGGLVRLDLIPVGAAAITRDIAQMLNATLSEAERLKTIKGAAFLSPRDAFDAVSVLIANDADGAAVQMPRSDLIAVIIPRQEEILENILYKMEADDRFAPALGRIVLCGGGSELQGIKEKAAALLDRPARIGRPEKIKNLPNQFESYTFLTGIGLLRYALMQHRDGVAAGGAAARGFWGKAGQWLVQNF
ncbi:MAG: cell division protein FtsA [Alphaproteobacteria bacterium]|nr:cell division protein FtsA [Alphaproteobacteria bacterium]